MAERSTRLLGQLDHRAVVEHAAKIVAPRRSLEEIANRQDRLIRSLGSQDDHTGTIFTRVRYRLGELEAERHATFDALAELDAAPQGELRALFDSLQLDIVYQPADSALDVAATLYDLGSETAQSAARESAEDWSAPPAGIGPATPGLGNQCSIH